MAKLDIECCPICCAPVKAIETWNSVRFEYDAPRWISVEERLPENDDDVLVFSSFGVSMGYYSVCGYWVDYVNTDEERITHWMPLPSAEGLHDN